MNHRVAVGAVLVALAAAGCGSSSSSSTTSSSSTAPSGATITPASYRAQVNKICASYNAKIKALPASTSNSIAGVSKLVVYANAALAQIKSVQPPSVLDAQVGAWESTVAESGSAADKILAALKSGKTSTAGQIAQQEQTLNTRANAQATALGLPACAEDVKPSGS